jgi:hypothetical protein
MIAACRTVPRLKRRREALGLGADLLRSGPGVPFSLSESLARGDSGALLTGLDDVLGESGHAFRGFAPCPQTAPA